MSAPTISGLTVQAYTDGSWTTLTSGAAVSNQYSDITSTVRSVEQTMFAAQGQSQGPDMSTLGMLVLGLAAGSSANRHRLTFTATYSNGASAGPSFFMVPSQPFSGDIDALTPRTSSQIDDFNQISGYYPTTITSLGSGAFEVQMHLVPPSESIGDRWGQYYDSNGDLQSTALSGNGAAWLSIMFEEGSRDASWDYDTLAEAIQANPTLMSDSEEEHQGVDENGDPIEEDDMGGPPSQATGMTVYTDADWNFVFNNQINATTGEYEGGLMGVEARSRANSTEATFRMFVPFRLAHWMGVDINLPLQLFDALLSQIDTASVENILGTDQTAAPTMQTRGYLIDVPVTFTLDVGRSLLSGMLARSSSQQVLFGQGGSVPCFHAMTPIPMAMEGHAKLVKDVVPGDRVRMADGSIETVRFVTHEESSEVYAVPRSGRLAPPLKVTGNHLVRLADGREYRADELAIRGFAHKVLGTHQVYHLALDGWGYLNMGGGLSAESCAWKAEHHAVRPNRGDVARKLAKADELGICKEAALAELAA